MYDGFFIQLFVQYLVAHLIPRYRYVNLFVHLDYFARIFYSQLIMPWLSRSAALGSIFQKQYVIFSTDFQL